MEGPRGAKLVEFEDCLNLINQVFRINRGEQATMESEFPLLLTRENIDNMRIIKDGNKVVSEVNFMTGEILVESTPIPYASIGAVCTHHDYEGQGLSSKILDDVEGKMLKDGVAICLISGTRSLYTRRDAMVLPSFKQYDILPSSRALSFDVDEYQDVDLVELHQLYLSQSTRYKRSLDAFGKLIDSATHDWGRFSYKRYTLRDNGIIIGYLVIRIVNEEDNSYGEVVEVLGDRRDIYASISYVTHQLDLSYCSYHVHVKETAKHLDHLLDYKIVAQQGTLKIINFQLLMEDLQTYFSDHLSEEENESLSFVHDGAYGLRFGKETIYTSRLADITRLIFACDGQEAFDFSNAPALKSIVDRVFPLAMPWTKNLNYQ